MLVWSLIFSLLLTPIRSLILAELWVWDLSIMIITWCWRWMQRGMQSKFYEVHTPYSINILEEPFSWKYVSAFTKNSFVTTLDIKRLQLSWFVFALPFNLNLFSLQPLFSFKICYQLDSILLSSSFFQLHNKSRFQCPLLIPALRILWKKLHWIPSSCHTCLSAVLTPSTNVSPTVSTT